MSAAVPPIGMRRAARARLRFARSWSARVGIVLALGVVGAALLGPLVAPYGPSEISGVPYTGPGNGHWLGTDTLGRDILARLLWGGRSLVANAVAATLIAYGIGVSIGLVAGYSRRLADTLLMRTMDVILSFPPLLLLLLLATGAGRSAAILVLGIALTHIPGIARIVRTATLEVSTRGYVEAAVARGESTVALLRREVLPNVLGVILADAGVRLTGSIILLASVNFLGLGPQPPAADWALMVSENRSAITLQAWAVAAPAAMIAALAIAANLISDGVARSLGTSTDPEALAR